MALSLEQLQAAFQQDNNKGNGGRSNNYYPFWNMQVGQQCVVRFLPDLNEENPLGFMVEKAMHTLYINGEKKSIPCLRMYGDDCPSCKVSQAYYKDGDKTNGKKYWRKKQHIAQALIVEDPLPPDQETGETHKGKVRFLALGFQIFKIIKDAFESGELDEVPVAYEGGCDFIIKKTQQGDYPSYTVGTKFARKTRDLSEEEIAHAEEHMVDLSTLLPQKPEEEKMESMLNAALTGAEYASSNNLSTNDSKSNSSDDDSSSKNENTQESTTVDSDDSSDSSDDDYEDEADEILKRIRERANSEG